ncbi:MAG TPA: patatin-like phospholipase family protein [Anaeromyxobacteraceae bacterium]|nr:patatin-like phospholipase family protein [Anaeromyxobacteraceae bacterium]
MNDAEDQDEGFAADGGTAPEELAQLLRERLVASLPGLFDGATPAARHDLLRLGHWLKVAGGGFLYRQGDPGDSMYVVVAGRMAAVSDGRPGLSRVLWEIRPGESVGEMGLLGRQPRSASVRALRDTILLRISAEAFQQLVAAHPDLLASTTRLLIRRLTDATYRRAPAEKARSVALVPLRPDDRWGSFVDRLRIALERRGPTRVVHLGDARRALTGEDVTRETRAGPPDARDLSLSAWLDAQELGHQWMLLKAEEPSGSWARRCVRQADTVLLVVPFDAPPAPDDRERALLRDLEHSGARCELVFLHPPGTVAPTATSRWLRARGIERHHHVRLDRDGDFRRLARFLTGDAVGVVMAGGGARAFAHIGVIRALREAGIAIDAVGGTSQGAIVAAMLSLDWDDATIERSHRRGYTERNPIGDYSLFPHLSLVKGRRLDAALTECFGDAEIEDAWRPFYCISTNLTLARPEVHRRGPMWRALRASISLPGILPPAVVGEHLHVDGGLLDNLPVEAMRETGVGRVVALDVGVKQELRMSKGALPSAGEFLKQRLSRGEQQATPGFGSILVKSFMIPSMQRTAQAVAGVDLYLNPEPADIGFLEWKALDRAVRLGYQYAKAQLGRRKLDGLLDTGATVELQRTRWDPRIRKYDE